MKSQDIRRSFVDFFERKDHKHAPGATLIPDEMSPTLFTIAGMEQFVPAFLGDVSPPAPRVVTVQRCLRVAGGKNDIENVGRSGRHGTFLEMLGNFSFGDYYKREAIAWAWEYLTETLRLPAERIHATVYVDDDEAAEIWHRDIGLPNERIKRFREDNFWDMGPTGPCGPCSEIFYDLGPEAGCGKPTCGPGCEHCDRHVEFWNLVFQQYDRDTAGALHPLPKKCIDTGMGFERLCMILAGKTSIFDTDLYQGIIAALPPISERRAPAAEQDVHRRIIADHARAATFLVADGVAPSNTERGYVLRFLTRRAIRSGRLLGFADGFLSALVPAAISSLVDGYPELRAEDERIMRVLQAEEHQFGATLARGSARLLERLEELKKKKAGELPGADAFELYDTFGFPVDLTREIAAESGIKIDMAGYRAAMEAQRERARQDARTKRADLNVKGDQADLSETTSFVGYESLEAKSPIAALLDKRGEPIARLESGQEGVVVLARTPFYAERGGQRGGRGVIARTGASFDVPGAQYRDKSHAHVLHKGRVTAGELSVGDEVDAIVDPHWRREIRRHHTVTHLLQRALKDAVGDAVAQRGSAVFPDRTRFDFDSPVGALSKQQRADVASRVNDLIRRDFYINETTLPFAEAIARGAIYMKGEHYGDMVRVVQFGPSVELCGGTHVGSTGEIGHFVLLAESAIGAGIRRVEGLVSEAADRYDSKLRETIEEGGSTLSTTPEQLPDAVARLTQRQRDLEHRLAALSTRLAAGKAAEHIADAKEADGIAYLTVRSSGDDGVGPRELADSIRASWPSGVLAVGGAADSNASLIVTVSPDLVKKGVSAKVLLAAIIGFVDGKGGGSPAIAQGAGKNPAGLDAALAALPDAIRKSRGKT